MFRDIRIESYRGLRNIELEDLGQINVLVGENNSGKTSILEAIQLFEDSAVPANVLSIARKREMGLSAMGRNRLQSFDTFLYSFSMRDEGEKEIYLRAYSEEYGDCRVGIHGDIYKDLFYREDISPAERRRYDAACDEDGAIRVIQGEYIYECGEFENGEFYFNEIQLHPKVTQDIKASSMRRKYRGNIMYISPMDIYTDKVLSASLYRGMLAEEKNRLLDLMCLFDDRIVGIETAVRQGRPVTMIEMEGIGLAPIVIFGDGLKKILTLASAVVKMRDGIILIDEFETGIHKRALEQVARWLIAVTERYNVQVFLTTHSSDAIAALVEAQGACENNVRAYRLEHYKDNIYVKKFTGSDLYILKNSQGMDIL